MGEQDATFSVGDKPGDPGRQSVARAIAGDYEFSISATLREAWEKTSGAKTAILLSIVLYLVISFIVVLLLTTLLSLLGVPVGDESWGSAAIQMIVNIVLLPIATGIFLLGVKRSLDLEISVGEVLDNYDKTLPLVISMLIMYVLVTLGFMLLILPGIYLAIAYYFAAPLIVGKELGPWQALEASRKSVTQKWFDFFGLAIMLMIINLIAAIPLGIGLIWTIPMSVVAYGVAYRNMFGYEPKDELW